MTAPIVIGSLAYLFHNDRVLLLQRANPPFKGYWSAPGGKMEFGESPQDCCIREVHEETGIDISDVPMSLRVLQTVVDVDVPIHWQLFIFRITLADVTDLSPHPNHNEGELRWVEINEITKFQRPYTDRQHWSHILDESLPIYQSKFVYDTPDNLTDERQF